jgi:6,7-dimethyl-8-ribityllumazine synthase
MQKILVIGTRSQAEKLPIAFSIIKDLLDSSTIEFDKILVNDVIDIATAIGIILENSEYDGILAVVEYEAKTQVQDILFREAIRGLNDVGIYFSLPLSIIAIEDQQVDADRLKKSVEGCLELVKIKNLYTNFSDEQVKGYKN